MIYREPEINRGLPWAILFAAFVLFGIVGAMDHAAEQRDHEIYCENVKDGTWPDYEGRMARGECNED